MEQTTPTVRIRSRTGCITCKVRRVKCDEEKPSCRRCRSTGRTCDGYAAPSPAQSNAGRLPENSNNEIRIIHHSPMVDRPVQMSVFPSWDRPLRSDEYQSLEFFHLQTTSCFGAKAGEFLLRSAYHDSSIRLAAMALGSLHRVFLFERTRYPDERMQGTQLALRQYNAAIRRGLTQMSEGVVNGSVDVILTMCVLFYCFESLQGHFKLALRHINSGLRIMKQQEIRSQTVQRKITLPTDVLRSLFTYLESQMLELEDGITAVDQLHPAALRPSNLPPVDSTHETCTLDDFSENFRLLYNRLLRLMTKMAPGGHADLNEDDEALDTPESVIADYIESQSQIYSWSAALTEYLEHNPLQAMDPASRRLATNLKMWNALVNVVLQMELPLVETSWDGFTPELATVVSLAEEVVNSFFKAPERRKRSPSPASAVNYALSTAPTTSLASDQHVLFTHDMPSPSTFSVSLGILPPLWIVATACRDSRTRYRAIDLMRRSRRREGLWDSVLFAEIATKVARVEERSAGIPEGVPYEPANLPVRARVTNITSTFGDGRMVHVRYLGNNSELMEETLTI